MWQAGSAAAPAAQAAGSGSAKPLPPLPAVTRYDSHSLLCQSVCLAWGTAVGTSLLVTSPLLCLPLRSSCVQVNDLFGGEGSSGQAVLLKSCWAALQSTNQLQDCCLSCHAAFRGPLRRPVGSPER